MFETSQVQARALSQGRQARFLTASFALHTLVVFGAVAASIASVEFPSQAPDQMMRIDIAARVQLPPAAPPRPQSRPATPAAATPATPRVQAQQTAPDVIPDVVTPVEPASGTGTTSDVVGSGDATGDETGDPNGVPGGIPGLGSGGGAGSEPVDVPLPVGGEVLAPRVLTRVTPEYPAIAARTGMKGVVVVECIIDRQGKVRDVRVLHSTFAAFDKAATDAVRQWTFAPGTFRGKTVDTIFNLTVTFSVNHAR
jgi:protein TonB